MKPVAVFDLETTGINPSTCRIVELGIQIMEEWVPTDTSFRFLINPTEPIPPHVAEIHGITDADIADAPTFADLAPTISQLLYPCDLAGFNILRFDLPVLAAEFARTDIDFDPYADRNLIDACAIFHQREPRTLSAAHRFYLGDDFEDAHSAVADAQATARVLKAQIMRYGLPEDPAALAALCRNPDEIDRAGRFRFQNGVPCINFGKHRGTALQSVDRGYLEWMLKSDFPDDTKAICREALAGTYPEQEEKA